jgi:hypothetical protein
MKNARSAGQQPGGSAEGRCRERGRDGSAFSIRLLISAVLLASLLSAPCMAVAADDLPRVALNAEKVVPRQVEDSTAQAVARDYSKAWQAMSAARNQNRPDLLGAMFVGTARNEIAQAILQQQKSGVRLRFVDHGHKLTAMFYSQEGSALQLRDVANVEVQVLDGKSVVHSEDATVNYIVVMTPAADHWQVRMLQALP